MNLRMLGGILLFVVSAGVNSSYAGNADDKSFLENYKSSFMDSCIESSGDEKFASTCRCVLNDLIDNFSIADLKDGKKVAPYIEKVAMGKCQK